VSQYPTVALVTYAGAPTLTADDRHFQAALSDAGMVPRAVNWDAPEQWHEFDAIVIRSPWDYYKRFDEYSDWLDRLEASGARVFNPVSLLRWNSTKRYLRELGETGVLVPPTEWIPAGGQVNLAELMRRRGWERIVVKPTVSATAYHTYRIGPVVSTEDQQRVDQLTAGREVMIQPYLSAVASAGELSLLFFDGEFSHAVLKRPKAGDFRVQSDFGGTVEATIPSSRIIAEAAGVLAAAPGRSLYARVDGCVIDGHFMLMELEAVEPCLFFEFDAKAAARLVAALQKWLAIQPSPAADQAVPRGTPEPRENTTHRLEAI
jgi:glutathione synthase/RimK-type ligase-like ATP-grasp enzyme